MHKKILMKQKQVGADNLARRNLDSCLLVFRKAFFVTVQGLGLNLKSKGICSFSNHRVRKFSHLARLPLKISTLACLLFYGSGFANSPSPPTVSKGLFSQGEIVYYVDNAMGFGAIEVKLGKAGALAKLNLSMKDANLNISSHYLALQNTPGTIYQIDHKKKTYIQYRSLPSSKTSTGSQQILSRIKLFPLGNDVHLGYPVKGFRVQENNQNTEIWLCENIKTFNFMTDFQEAVSKYGVYNTALSYLVQKGYKGFPLKITHNQGGLVTSLEATKIQPQNYPPGLFVIPPEYSRAPESDDVMTKLKDLYESDDLKNILENELSPEQRRELKDLLRDGL